MNFWYLIYLLTLSAAFVLTVAATPLCIRLARVTGYLDMPKSEQHKLHKKATPLLGGLAMCSAWLLTILGGSSAALLFAPEHFLDFAGGFRSILHELLVIGLGAAAATALGLIDDKHAMKAGTKFLGQLAIAAAVVIFGGIRISLFIGGPWFSCAVSIFWLLFIFNAINFFDNMDGLAVGTAAIAFTFFALAAVVNQQYFVANLCFCSAGAAYGFWIFNHSPAAIFMGDAGSHFIGFLIGVISAKVTYYNPELASTRFAVLIPLFILAVPVFDALAVVVIRLRHHKPIYIGDHNHISHRFLHMGMSRPHAVRMVHLLVLIGSLGALPLLWGDSRTCIVLLIQGLVLLLLLSLLQYEGIKAQKKRDAENAEPNNGDPAK